MTDLSHSPAVVNWHSLDAETAISRCESRLEGLREDEVNERLQRFGPNLIPAGRPDGPLKLLWRQINSPLLFVLLGSGFLALLLGKLTDGAVVLGVVALNALIGFIQEHRAQKAISALGSMVPETATVRRANRTFQIHSREVVPGDMLLLQSGDRVPADLRLLSVKNLQVDESALTGESVPVPKQTGAVPDDSPLGDRICMTYGGTMVTYGTGAGVAVATGGGTELGRISALLRQTTELATPLTRAMAKVSLWLTLAILAVTALLFGVSLLRGYLPGDAVVAAISLAVAAIPEGLPAIITIALAIGVRRMARRRVIIRSLPAVETLGSTTVICSDKTGTLTRNEMTVQSIWTPAGACRLTGTGYNPVGQLLREGQPVDSCPEEVLKAALAGVLCNDAGLEQKPDGNWTITGDPTEAALVVAGRKLGLSEEVLRREWKRLDTVPFESERQIMGTLHQAPDGNQVVFIKGAPEAVLRRCTSSPDLHQVVESLAGSGMRVLAMASRVPDESIADLEDVHLEAGFSLLGLQGMLDPPRQEAIEAVAACRTAGITVKMITGDHAGTAQAIGRELGLATDRPAVTGAQLSGMSGEKIKDTARSSAVFARVAPEHKLRLVEALQEDGEVVAMTGDGVNDAPALKRADIGVAMGINGTAVSRQAADMVLTDDNFASIVAAVEEGRRVYDNLVKSLAFVLPTNIGEALVIIAAVLFFPVLGGQPLMPILPVQILWVNLVATVALALPLAFEVMEPNLMQRPPRKPGTPILDAFVVSRTIYVALLMTAGAISVFYLELHLGPESGAGVSAAQTTAVTAIVIFQIFYMLTCRSVSRSIFSIGVFSNPVVFLGILSILILQLGFVYLPGMNALFGSVPIGPAAWLRAALAGAVVLPVVMVEKVLRRKRG